MLQVQVIATTEEAKEYKGEKYVKRAAQCVGNINGLQKVFTVNLQKDAPAPKPGLYELTPGFFISEGRLQLFVESFRAVASAVKAA